MAHAAAAMYEHNVQRGHDRSGSGDLPVSGGLKVGKYDKGSVKLTQIVRPLVRSLKAGVNKGARIDSGGYVCSREHL